MVFDHRMLQKSQDAKRSKSATAYISYYATFDITVCHLWDQTLLPFYLNIKAAKSDLHGGR